MTEIIAYASSSEFRKNQLVSAAQHKSALTKNVAEFDIPLVSAISMNVWKAKAIARGKLLERFRDLIMNMADTVGNEGDRVYFGSTNDYHELREIGQEMDMWNWDRIIRDRPERDPYADCRQYRALIETLVEVLEAARGYIEPGTPFIFSTIDEVLAAAKEISA